MKKILMVILDGFGMREDIYGNAIKNAGMNNFIHIWNNYPHALLKSASTYVGLEKDECGSSEIGHKVIGAGRKITSRKDYVNKILDSHDFARKEKYIEMLDYLKQSDKNLHLFICLSDGGVISDINHLKKAIQKLRDEKIKNKLYIHAIADGIDAGKNKVYNYIKEIEDLIENNVHLASICGRYYALDTTNDSKRTNTYFHSLITGDAIEASSIPRILNLCYQKRISDEYLPPLKTLDFVPLKEGDAVWILNTSKGNNKALLERLEKGFPNRKLNLKVYSLFEISKNLNRNYMLESLVEKNTLGEYLANLGITQARVVESCKKESMTYYFDGERRIIADIIDTFVIETTLKERYDVKPELNALKVAKTAIKCMENDYDFVTVNFANPDIIGHTGNYQAVINGLQAVDVCLGEMVKVAEENFYKVIIVGTHGKADTIINRKNEIISKNTLSPVPFIILDNKVSLENGSLTGVAPTILKYMDINLPKKMKETEDLFEKKD